VNRVLLLEPSATRRRAVRTLLSARGHQIAELARPEQALALLPRVANATGDIDALVFGWPDLPDAHSGELLERLRQDDLEHFPVLLLAERNDAGAVNWMMKRPSTALLLWSDYSECADALGKLLNPPSLPPAETGGRGSAPLRVLFVDDSATVRVAFRRLLSKHGYLVETAENVEDGWAMALAAPFDIAIVDYFMPGEPGPVLVRRLKEHPRTAHILSAVITGTYSDRVINESIGAGALECLFKSEARELFLARLASLARAVQDRLAIDAERRRLHSILGSVGDGVYGVDARGTIEFANPAALDILGYNSEDELIGRNAAERIHSAFEDGTPIPRSGCFLSQCYARGDQVSAWQTAFWSAAGQAIPVECTVFPLEVDGRREGSVIAFRDVSARRRLEEELRWQASHDALTKLKNRGWFEAQLDQEIARLKRSGQSSLLLFIDLDRFKYINDTAGHTAGDHLLVEIGRRLAARLRGNDQLARMGGDEYAVILRNVPTERAAQTAEEFRRAVISAPFAYGGKNYRAGLSIGVAVLDAHTPSRIEAMASADIALHLAKRNGRNQAHVFSADADQRARMDLELGWSARLEEALRQDQFVLCFQPIVPLDGSSPRPAGRLPEARPFHEALVRLRDSNGGLVGPAAFLPAAERFSLIAEIDRWVIRTAFRQLREQTGHGPPIGITLNLSAQSLGQPDLARYVTDRLVEFDVDPRAVVFEITESGALHHLEAARQLVDELRGYGCRFALDDFGVGFSSFAHLKQLDVDILKIDGSFIQGLPHDPVDLAVVGAITGIAHSVGKCTVAEYVDRPEILDALRECGVDYVQGYHIGRPVIGLAASASQPPSAAPAEALRCSATA